MRSRIIVPGNLSISGLRFCIGPLALSPKTGKDRPRHHSRDHSPTLAGDAEGDGCARGASFCPILKHAQDNWKKLVKTRCHCAGSRLRRNCLRRKGFKSLYPGGGHAVHWVAANPRLIDLQSVQRRIDRALALAAGLEIVAESDRGEVVAGESFTVDAGADAEKNLAASLAN